MKAWAACLALCLLACAPADRQPLSSPAVELQWLAGPPGREPIGDYGLAYRLVTIYAPADGPQRMQEFYGVNGTPLLIDADADPATGVAGADLAVHVYALAAAYVLEVRRLHAASLPLRLEAELSDPLQMLGAPADERLVLGFDARAGDAAGRFRQALVLADLGAALPGVQSATLEIAVEDAPPRLTALGGRRAPAGGRLDIALDMLPPPAETRVEVLFGNGLQGADYRLATSAASRFDLHLRETDGVLGEDNQQLLLDGVDGRVSLKLEQSSGTRLALNAERPVEQVIFSASRPGHQTWAMLAPLPQSLDACLASDDRCGSHGSSTDGSLSLQASEPVRLDYRAERNGELTLVEDMRVHSLAVDFGASSSFRRGYVYFDTEDRPFRGRVRQDDGRRGFDLRFGAGTVAAQRRVRWKNYVQADRREGRMRCPGGARLDLKVDGRFYDADFIVDTLCQ